VNATTRDLCEKIAPGSGAIFGFRGKRADRIKLLWWDGQGFILSLAESKGRGCASDAVDEQCDPKMIERVMADEVKRGL